MRKPAFRICENKSGDQLRGNRAADQGLCFCYVNSTIPLLPLSRISSLSPKPSSVALQHGLCQIWLENPKIGLVTMELGLSINSHQIHFLSVPLFDDVRISCMDVLGPEVIKLCSCSSEHEAYPAHKC